MSRVIHSLSLKNFRSFADVRVDLPNPTFLVGRNGAGKSGFLDAIQLLSDSVNMGLSAALQLRGGISNVRRRTPGSGKPPHMAISVDLQQFNSSDTRYRYGFELAPSSEHGYRVSSEICRKFTFDPEKLVWTKSAEFTRINGSIQTGSKYSGLSIEASAIALPFLLGTEEFSPLKLIGLMSVFDPQPGSIRQIQDPTNNSRLDRTASNIATVLKETLDRKPENIDRLNDFLEVIARDTRVTAPIRQGTKLAVTFEQIIRRKKLPFEAFSMSDGTLRSLALLVAVFQHSPSSLIAIEEPEISIHAGAMGVIEDLLDQAREDSHLIVSTQSPELLNSELVLPSSIRLVEWKSGVSTVVALSDVAKGIVTDHLFGVGDLVKMNQLDGSGHRDQSKELVGDETWSSN